MVSIDTAGYFVSRCHLVELPGLMSNYRVNGKSHKISTAPLINIDLRPTVIAERFNGKHMKPTLH